MQWYSIEETWFRVLARVLKYIVYCCLPWSCGGNPSPCGLVHDERCDERKDEPHDKHSPEKHLEAHVARDQPQPQQSHRLRWEGEGERGGGGERRNTYIT